MSSSGLTAAIPYKNYSSFGAAAEVQLGQGHIWLVGFKEKQWMQIFHVYYQCHLGCKSLFLALTMEEEA